MKIFNGRWARRAKAPQTTQDCRSKPEDLHRLIYVSEACPPGEPESMTPTPVQFIAEAGARRNAILGLDGALVSVSGHFIQILEGDIEALELVFERICRDMRHRALTLVDLSPAAERIFAGWDLVPLDGTLAESPEPFHDLLLSIQGGMAPASIVRDVKTLLDGA